MAATAESIVRVGILGCGEIAQVAHIPTLNFLSSKFKITYLCDVSAESLAFCAERVAGTNRPKTTTVASELCSSPDIDAVLVCNPDAFHTPHAILALQNDKHVLIEKPMALCHRDVDALAQAEKTSKGKVFVGYMRRYASAFLDAINEVGGTEKIQYVRVRDIIGPNSVFVDQSATFPKRFTDVTPEASKELYEREASLFQEALEKDIGIQLNDQTRLFLRILGGLGSHDLSAMREIIGLPKRVLGARLQLPIWQALFEYDGFAVTYESGINGIPVFDACIEIFTQEKIVIVKYDTPYVKGLPTVMIVREKVGEAAYQERTLRTTYQDPYTKEMLEWHDCITTGRTPKTSIEDARNELELFKMIMKAAN